ncbi:MAG: recombinase RecA [Clostridia bacterium]|nr:recombinase RecA [Clostridia bacterium]
MAEKVVDKKKEALQVALAQVEKKYGKGSVMRLGENARMEVSSVSTGSLSLDLALGIGGLPRGRIIEIYGPESSGKTTVALHAIAEVQKQGGEAAFIDAEHTLDPVYAKALGVNIDELLVSQPDDGEQALEIAEALIRSGAVEIVVVDSVAALVPKSEIDNEMGSANVGVQARLMSQALRKLSGAVAKSNCIVIFINQLRLKIGVFYGNPETTTGGTALKFYASVRIDIRKAEQLKSGSEIVGNHTKCKVVKNKVAPPFKTAEFDILYGKGISKESEIIELGIRFGIIDKSGSWLSYNGERLGQGKDKVRELITENKALADEIEAKIREKCVGGIANDSAEDEDDFFGEE